MKEIGSLITSKNKISGGLRVCSSLIFGRMSDGVSVLVIFHGVLFRNSEIQKLTIALLFPILHKQFKIVSSTNFGVNFFAHISDILRPCVFWEFTDRIKSLWVGFAKIKCHLQFCIHQTRDGDGNIHLVCIDFLLPPISSKLICLDCPTPNLVLFLYWDWKWGCWDTIVYNLAKMVGESHSLHCTFHLMVSKVFLKSILRQILLGVLFLPKPYIISLENFNLFSTDNQIYRSEIDQTLLLWSLNATVKTIFNFSDLKSESGIK